MVHRPQRLSYWSSLVACLGLVYCAFGTRLLTERGVRQIAPARTVASRTGSVPQDTEDLLLLLQAASEMLPRSTVSVISPARRSASVDQLTYHLSIGQLPGKHVLHPRHLEGAQAPEYVIAFRGDFRDPRYELLRATPQGTISARR